MDHELRPEYGMYPLWVDRPDGLANLDPDEFGVGDALRSRLLAWDDSFQATYDRSDPARSGFTTPAAARSFEVEGRALLGLLRAELGADRVRSPLDAP